MQANGTLVRKVGLVQTGAADEEETGAEEDEAAKLADELKGALDDEEATEEATEETTEDEDAGLGRHLDAAPRRACATMAPAVKSVEVRMMQVACRVVSVGIALDETGVMMRSSQRRQGERAKPALCLSLLPAPTVLVLLVVLHSPLPRR